MKILLTGASSFTGSWFASALADAGHHVTAIFRGHPSGYSNIRGERVARIINRIEPIWGAEFGSAAFLDAIRGRDFDVLCHHAAEMHDYRSWDFDVLAATTKNTRAARQVLSMLAERGCAKILLTGSVFEPYEGVGDAEAKAFNPYGLSKHLSFELFRMEAERLGLGIGKFVIPNPFGPYEEARFTAYLMREWALGRVPNVATPRYVRDNIHVSLLALAYRNFCEQISLSRGVQRAAPSGYVESQGGFAHRVAREIGARLSWRCDVTESVQSEFPEPLFRANADLSSALLPAWSEEEAWDAMAAYYESRATTD